MSRSALKTWGFRARQPLRRQHSADFPPLALFCDHTRNSCDHKCRFYLENPVFLRKTVYRVSRLNRIPRL